ncbi:MAG TPA: hypothetical protein GX717_05480, partial [Clostridiaceae bacterium]|nr:hypothetical protein [Clostridiaceae bacterium]
MGVKVSIEHLTQEVKLANVTISSHTEKTAKTYSQFELFCQETRLTGQAYQAVKHYIYNSYMPLLLELKDIHSALITANQDVLKRFHSLVSDDSEFATDTDVLEAKIISLQQSNRNSQ